MTNRTAMLSRADGGLDAYRPGPVFADVVRGWLDSFRAPGTRDTYARAFGVAVRREMVAVDRAHVEGVPTIELPTSWLRWMLALECDPLDVSRMVVDRWVNHLEGAGLAASTVTGRLAAVRHFYRYAHRLGAVDANPTADVDRPRLVGDISRRWADREQLVRLLDAAEGSVHDSLVISLAALGGLRASEIAGLDVSDVHFDADRVWLRVLGKGGKLRSVAVGSHVGPLLRSWVGDRTDGPLFPSNAREGRETRFSVNSTVGRVAEAAGLGKLSPHDLRRSCATLALDAGQKVDRVAAHLGHASTRTTLRNYDQAHGDLDRSPIDGLTEFVMAVR